MDFLGLDLGPPGPAGDVVYGNRTANHVSLSAEVVGGRYHSFEIMLGGSGGIDNIDTGAPIPEPGTAALVGLGLAGLAFARRRPIA